MAPRILIGFTSHCDAKDALASETAVSTSSRALRDAEGPSPYTCAVTLSARAALLLSLGACAVPPPSVPIAPGALPEAPAPYTDADRAFVAPAGGRLSQSEGDTIVDWSNGARLTVTSISSGRDSVSDESIVRGLHAIRTLEDRPLMKEDSPGAILLCVEGAPPTHTSACSRIDAESRRGGALILSTFVAGPAVYASMGGARVAAEAARSARGFGAGGQLPPP
jgi:hypothetical protein